MSELRIELDVRLGVVVDYLQRPAEQSAARIDLVNRELQRVDHRRTGGRNGAGLVVQAADDDRVFSPERTGAEDRWRRDQRRRCNGRVLKETASRESHGGPHGLVNIGKYYDYNI